MSLFRPQLVLKIFIVNYINKVKISQKPINTFQVKIYNCLFHFQTFIIKIKNNLMQKLQKSLKHKNQSNKTFYEFARLFFTFNKKCLKEKFDWKISKQNKFNFYFLNLKQKSVNHSFFSFIDPITNRWFIVKSLTNISLENFPNNFTTYLTY